MGYCKGFCWGDSGYPCFPYLFTPILNPADPSEVRYNASHVLTRNCVERTFEVWKRRFACLSSKMAMELPNIVNVICATAVLHNICIETDDVYVANFNMNELQEVQMQPIINRYGHAVRRAFIQEHFSV